LLFVVGLWPFNFSERNNISVSQEEGLTLARHGSAYTASSPGKLQGLSRFAIFVDVETSSDGLSAFEKIVSYGDSQTEMNFILGQWKDGFIPVLRTDQKIEGIKVGVKDALRKDERSRFLISYDGKRLYLHQDGLVRIYRETGPLTFSNWSRAFPLVVGTDANGKTQWRGTIYEIAIWDRALSPNELKSLSGLSSLSGRKDKKSKSEIAAHPAGARNDSKEQDNRPLIHYVFKPENTYETEVRGGKALGVRDLGKGEPEDLVIPEQFMPYKRSYLAWDPDWLEYKSNWLDLAVNILGFIPFGMLLVFAFRKVTGCRLQATGVGTNNGFPASGVRLRVQSKVAIAVILAVAAGFAVSFAIEYLQAYVPSRDSSLRDLIANTTGTLLGALAVLWYSRKRIPCSV